MLDFILFLVLALVLLLWILFFSTTMWIYRQTPSLSEVSYKSSYKSLPLISIVIPARNEEHRIGKCIESIKSQTYTKMEIIIVDDYSTDGTVNISKKIIGSDKRFTVLSLQSIQEQKPSDWIGKSYALHQGSKHTNGEWLVFIDADIILSPEVIKKAVAFVTKKKLDFLGFLPHHFCNSFWTKVIQPIPLELLLMNLYNVNKQKSKVAFAFGCIIYIRRTVFNAVGGYEKIKDKISDDAEMAKLVKRSGFKIGIVNAQDLVKVEMYEKFNEIWEGWGKNIFLGFVQNTRIQSKALKALLIVTGSIFILCAFIFPFIIIIPSLIYGLFYHFPQWVYLSIFSSFVWLFGVFIQFRIQKRYSIGDPKYALLSILGCTLIITIFFNAAIKIMSGKGVMWKERIYFNK